MERRETYRRLMPEVDVRLLLTEPVTSHWAERDEPQSLHDEDDYVGESLGYRGTPSAVLLWRRRTARRRAGDRRSRGGQVLRRHLRKPARRAAGT